MNIDIEGLVAELRAADVSQRRAAAEAFTRSGAASAMMPLVEACGDSDELVQEFACAALESLGAPSADTASQLAVYVNQEGPTGYWAVTLLGRLQSQAGPWSTALGQALQENPDMSVRQRAAWALGQIGPGAADGIPALQLAMQEENPRLVRLATEALHKIEAST